MRYFLIFTLFLAQCATAQHSFRISITHYKTHEALQGVSVAFPNSEVGNTTNQHGRCYVSGIETGEQTLIISLLGYETIEKTIVFPLAIEKVYAFELKEKIEVLSGVKVTATRRDTHIEKIPVRAEVIGLEDIEEKTNQVPNSLGHLFTETSGVHLQTTSVLSGNVQVRLQGLPGRYTQVVRDGMPIYGGLGQGFSLIQIPPIDLKQAEVIKGAGSSYFGADAMAGVINLVSKKPSSTPEIQALLSQTHKKGTDFSGFYSRKLRDDLGLTLLAQINRQTAFDVNNDGWADIAKVRQFTLSPKVFYSFNRNTEGSFGVTHTTDNRRGGLMEGIRNSLSFFQENSTSRTYTNLLIRTRDVTGGTMTVKNSLHFYNQNINQFSKTAFKGQQFNSYTEVSYDFQEGKHHPIVGGTYTTDVFAEPTGTLDYRYRTFGAFGQDEWSPMQNLTLQVGLRGDYAWKIFPSVRSRGESFVMPRVGALYKLNENMAIRMGGGMGYRMPSLFLNETETIGFEQIAPIPTNRPKHETSTNVNADFDYKKNIGNIGLHINQAVFYTRINNGMITTATTGDSPYSVEIRNSTVPISSAGAETNVHVDFNEFNLFMAYTFTDARMGTEALTFAPKHKLVATGLYKQEGNYRLGVEITATSKQYLGNQNWGKGYAIIGLSAEKYLKKNYAVIVNIANLTDTRQTRWERLVENYSGAGVPNIRPIYADVQGVLMNVAIRAKL